MLHPTLDNTPRYVPEWVKEGGSLSVTQIWDVYLFPACLEISKKLISCIPKNRNYCFMRANTGRKQIWINRRQDSLHDHKGASVCTQPFVAGVKSVLSKYDWYMIGTNTELNIMYGIQYEKYIE